MRWRVSVQMTSAFAPRCASASALGKLRQTGTPQKWVPSVQRGEIRPLRTTHGGPTYRASLRVDLRADLRDLVHRGEIDLFLGVEARAQRPLVQEGDERARLHHAQRLGVRQHVHRELERHAELEQPVLRVPCVPHRALVRRQRDADSPRSAGAST